MQQRGLAGLVVIAADRYTSAMYYVTGQKLHHAAYFRSSDGRAHLIHDAMERDQAALVGCELSTFAQHGFNQRVDQEGPAGGWASLIVEMLANLGISGTVAFFGDLPAGQAWDALSQVTQRNPALAIDRTYPDVLALARATKSADEIAAIRRASQGVLAGWNALREHLRSLKRDGDHYVNGGGQAVKLGDLRALVHREFAARGLEGGDSIFSQGRDAGVPHNRGNDDEVLRPGAPVIVDIFPAEAGGGYHSDFTRTFCMGKASDELKKVYGDCEDAFRLAMDSLKIGEPCRAYQDRVCELFESRGHVTIRKNQTATEGYVHGLGHGVGLAVHEAPRMGGPPSNTQTLEPGMVITIEPGLYYPSRGLGVRIEDLVVMTENGYENLTATPWDLEIGA
jgi:Xaa-Pro aminopeptidase